MGETIAVEYAHQTRLKHTRPENPLRSKGFMRAHESGPHCLAVDGLQRLVEVKLISIAEIRDLLANSGDMNCCGR